jgi:hypothetical protein
MDPEMQNAIKKQIILRAIALGVAILFALVVFYYIQISQGRELSQGILREEATPEDMALFAKDLGISEIVKSTFVCGELRGNLDEVYRFTLTLSLDSREQVDAMLTAMEGFENTDPDEATINPKPDVFFVRRTQGENEDGEAEEYILRANFYLSEERDTAQCILQWTNPGEGIQTLFTKKNR